jgi:hypothetical protein
VLGVSVLWGMIERIFKISVRENPFHAGKLTNEVRRQGQVP